MISSLIIYKLHLSVAIILLGAGLFVCLAGESLLSTLRGSIIALKALFAVSLISLGHFPERSESLLFISLATFAFASMVYIGSIAVGIRMIRGKKQSEQSIAGMKN